MPLLANDWPYFVVAVIIGAIIYAVATASERKRADSQRTKERETIEKERVNAQPLAASEVDSLYSTARQRIVAACEALHVAAVRRHPLIKFRPPNEFTLIGLHSLRADLAGMRRDRIATACAERAARAVNGFRRQLGDDFKAHQCELMIREIAAGSHGPAEFWESEEKYRATTKGTEAEDWEVRRAAVHSRDHGICLRCGCCVTLQECHIHHTKKSRHGGTNELTNLATLCRDCHCMMPAHEHMKAPTRFPISGGLIHRPTCKSLPQHTVKVKRSRRSWRTGKWSKRKYNVEIERPNLEGLELLPYNIGLERGHTPCPLCNPDSRFKAHLENWLPSVLRGNY